jgi:dimeric dUTPase (all-alpha-NTP-PPase superfamily)
MIESWFKDQEEFQKMIFKNFKNLSEDEKIALTKEMLLHITSEFDELLSSLGSWKTHKIRKSPPKISGICEELVDIAKFIINIALIWDISPNYFERKWAEKTLVNKYKFTQEQALLSLKDKKIVVFDVDGVLNDFPEAFVGYVNCQAHRNFFIQDFLDIPKKILYEEYLEIKHKFYENYSDFVEFSPEAKEVLTEIRRRGISIVLLTSRPISEYKKFYYEILKGLIKSNIPFDALIEDREKGLRIIKDFKNVLFAVDDDPYYVDDISSYGIKAFLLSKPYNKTFKGYKIINRLEEVLNELV